MVAGSANKLDWTVANISKFEYFGDMNLSVSVLVALVAAILMRALFNQ